MRSYLKWTFCNMACFVYTALILTGMPSPASAQNYKPVVELFTSQGCSSCPPADAFLGTLIEKDEVIALTFPVDYWDYLGWKDTLASPEFSARQRSYAKARGDGEVYTPQMVIGGATHHVGNHKSEIQNSLQTLHSTHKAYDVSVTATVKDESLWIEAKQQPQSTSSQKASLWLASVCKSKAVNIRKGENRGETVTYFNVVRQFKQIGQWSGEDLKLQIPKKDFMTSDTDFFIVLLQSENYGPILGSVKIQEK